MLLAVLSLSLIHASPIQTLPVAAGKPSNASDLTSLSAMSSSVKDDMPSPLSVNAIYIAGWKDLPSSYLLPTRLTNVTHLLFSFMDLSTSHGTVFFNASHVHQASLDDLATIREAFPDIQIGVSLGGWSYRDHFRAAWASLAQGQSVVNGLNINATADSLIPYLKASNTRRYYFDFVDIDWEYPTDALDDAMLALFFARMNDNFHAFNLPDAYITYTLAPNYAFQAYPRVSTFQDNIKYFFVMEYDYSGAFSKASELNASVKQTTENMLAIIAKGLPASRLVFGITGLVKRFQGTTGLHAPYTAVVELSSPASDLPNNYCNATAYATMMNDTITDS